MFSGLVYSLFAGLFTLSVTTAGLAQVEKGTITGLITDRTGAVVGQAKVTILNLRTKVPTLTETDAQGLFVAPPLDPGEYEVKIEAPGLQSVIEHVRLEVVQRIRADASLGIQAASESIEVKASAIQFDTDTSTVSSLRTEEAVHNLPLNGRNFTELLGIGAGVVPGQSQLTGSIPYAQQRGPSAYSMNGQLMPDNRFLLDGIGDPRWAKMSSPFLALTE